MASLNSNQNYKDNYYGSILDPLHGDIKLSEIEKWIIAQPLFARLRRVKQNTFLFYVFPSANHTRFEHSIGVMHLAGKIFEACKENFATGVKKNEKYKDRKDSSFFDLNSLGEREETFYQELRLAALLHDVGHGPLSHLFDEFAISTTAFLKLVKQSPTLQIYYDGFAELIKKKGKVEHEVLSCAFIFYLIDRLKKKSLKDPHKFSADAQKVIETLDAGRIVKMIEPDFQGLSTIEDEKGNDYTYFFSKIVSGFPIDADRMDYLLRDSYFSGVTYGIYDINRIFSSFLAAQNASTNVELALKESGVDSVLRFIQSRTHLYNQVYFHKTNRAANTMLTFSTQSFRSNVKGGSNKLLDTVQNTDELRRFYIKNSDEFFILDTVPNKLIPNSSQSEKEVHDCLISRVFFKRVYQHKLVFKGSSKPDREKINDIKVRMNEKLKALEGEGIIAVADSYDNVTFKDANEKAILFAFKKEGKYHFRTDWDNINLEFQMSDITASMVRIYLKRDFSNPDEFKSMRSRVNEHVKDEINELEKLIHAFENK